MARRNKKIEIRKFTTRSIAWDEDVRFAKFWKTLLRTSAKLKVKQQEEAASAKRDEACDDEYRLYQKAKTPRNDRSLSDTFELPPLPQWSWEWE